MTTYSQLLLDPRWQKIRLKKLEESGWKCHSCESEETTLHVHHRQYVRGRKPWEYELSELRVLCAECHKESHDNIAIITKLLEASPCPETLVGLCVGFSEAAMELPDDVEPTSGCGMARMIGMFAEILHARGVQEWHAVASAITVCEKFSPHNPVEDAVLAAMLT